MSLDENKLMEFMGKVVGDLGAAAAATLVILGDRLGLYKAMADGAGHLPAELAAKTKTNERYVREWLDAQAAGGYVIYDAARKTYALPPEQAFALAEEMGPASAAGAFHVIQAMYAAIPKMEGNFRTGGGIEWGDQHPCLFEGTERFFRASYIGNLIGSWIPALEGVKSKLEKGARVADVGCGLGASAILMAKAFPRSKFFGFDLHAHSIETARRRAAEAGVTNATFDVAGAGDYPGTDYDLVAHFDCLHDMVDPIGAARQVRRTVAKDGTWLIVEPLAGDRPEENHNGVGRLYYAASTMLCVPNSLAHQGVALGAQAGERRLRQVAVEGGGFTRFRRATETPFNLIFEARP